MNNIPLTIDERTNKFVYFSAEIINAWDIYVRGTMKLYDARIASARPGLGVVDVRVEWNKRNGIFYFEDQNIFNMFLQDIGIKDVPEGDVIDEVNRLLVDKAITAYVCEKQDSHDIIGIAKR